jgi:hypothetical protein
VRSFGNPRIALASLVLVQWAALFVFVLVVRHNGWLFYQGGDQTYFYTSSWAISGGHLPEAAVGYGWSYLLAPITLAFGPSFLAGLPAVVLFQAFVLLPVGLYCVYAIAARIGGQALGYFAAAAWVVVPFAAIPLWDDRFHEKYTEQFLPQALGLTGLADFPSMVCLLVAALFCMRALDAEDHLDGFVAGLAAGFAIGIKPANALFLAGPLLAFAAARRFRELVGFAVALLPSLLALALWKYRGLGHLPALTAPSETFALDARLADGLQTPPLGLAEGRYLDLDWSRLGDNYVELRDLFWGVPLLQSLPILGFAVTAARSLPKALLLGGWVAPFVLVKGSFEEVSLAGGTFLRLFMPGFPPLLILAALVPLLVPWLRRETQQRAPAPAPPVRRRSVALGAAVFTLVPLLLFAALPPLEEGRAATISAQSVYVPVDGSFDLRADVSSQVVELTWKAHESASADVFYTVYRSPVLFLIQKGSPVDFPTVFQGLLCDRASGGTARCSIEMRQIATTRAARWAEGAPSGRWTYRVGVGANWRDDENFGDALVISRPVSVTVR